GNPALHRAAAADVALRPRPHRPGSDPHAALRARDGRDDAVPPCRDPSLRRAQARAREPAKMSAAAILEVKGITKRFGGLTALTDVSFAIQRGEIYGLIGPNGAGKTTLFNVLTGLYRQDEGEFRFEGKVLGAVTPDRIAALGIARTFQNIR